MARKILARLSEIAEGMGLEALRPQLDACRNQLEGGGAFDVAVYGRFKAGKSSLLNHLAGAEALPVGVVPVTAVITRLRYGPEARATVIFRMAPGSRSQQGTWRCTWASGTIRATGRRCQRWKWNCRG